MSDRRIKCGRCSRRGEPVYHASIEEVKECHGPRQSVWEAPQEEVVRNPASWTEAQRESNQATQRMWDYIVGLTEKRPVPDKPEVGFENEYETMLRVKKGLPVGFDEAGNCISWLRSLPEPETRVVSPPNPGPNRPPPPPAGRYALDIDGHIMFFRVDRPTSGRWAGYVFAKQLIGSVGSWEEKRLSKNAQLEIIDLIGANPQEAAQLFGMKARRCGNCMSPLSKPQSRAAGYGEQCAIKNGWYYPRPLEALKILGERGEPTGLEDSQAETAAS